MQKYLLSWREKGKKINKVGALLNRIEEKEEESRGL